LSLASQNPRAFKGIKVFPVHYRANKRAWVTPAVFPDWSKNCFVPETWADSLLDDCKIVLLLDNCPAHPAAQLLIKDSVFAIYLLPNCTSLIQPMDQGILHFFKCKYKDKLMHKMLNACNNGMDIKAFQKLFNMKDVLWRAEETWTVYPKKS
jgi:hypothetical protein